MKDKGSDNKKGRQPSKPPVPLAKNDIFTALITATGSAGEGIARCNGMAVFVPAAAEGDTVELRIVKVLRNMAYGKIERIITPSPDRTEPDCTVFPKCGGCVFRHISYEAECRLKLRRVCDAFERIGGLDVRPDSIVPGNRTRCRNKAQYPCGISADGRPVFGFYARHSHRIIECSDCLLQPESFASITAAVSRYMTEYGVMPYDGSAGTGAVRHLYLRSSSATGEIMICIVCAFGGPDEKLPREDRLTEMLREAAGDNITILININSEDTNVILGRESRVVYGRGYITDTLLGLSFRISPLSFFQVSRDQAQVLYSIAAEYAGVRPSCSVESQQSKDKIDTLLDMYCGTGTIGLTMAHGCNNLIGVEAIEDAVRDARENAQRNGVSNAEFICADAAEAARSLKKRGIRPDVVLLDPPRKGCSAQLLETVVAMSPDRIVYISCDPATLARDLALLCASGYTAIKARAVDMFPGTSHVETVVLLITEHNNRR